MSTAQHRVIFRDLLAAAPNFVIAGGYLITWVAPYTLGRQMVAHLMLVMLLEFIVIHSAAFMGNTAFSKQPKRKRIRGVLFFGGFYTLFVAGFALAFGKWWPFVAFWLLTFNRLSGLVLGQAPSGTEKQLIQRGWAASVLFYLLGAMLTTLLPIPAWGITSEVAAAQEFSATGLWIDEPQRVIALGLVYFALLGISEVFGHGSFRHGIDKK